MGQIPSGWPRAALRQMESKSCAPTAVDGPGGSPRSSSPNPEDISNNAIIIQGCFPASSKLLKLKFKFSDDLNDWKLRLSFTSTHKLGDVGISSVLIGSLSLTNEQLFTQVEVNKPTSESVKKKSTICIFMPYFEICKQTRKLTIVLC